MPTITVRITEDEEARLGAAYADWASRREVGGPEPSMSEYIRETLDLRAKAPSIMLEVQRIDDNVNGLVNTSQAILRRLERLEEMAGL